MAEIAALLDSAGLAGIRAGKKDHKGPTLNGLAQDADQAGFIAALMSQLNSADAPNRRVAAALEVAVQADAAVNGTSSVAVDPLLGVADSGKGAHASSTRLDATTSIIDPKTDFPASPVVAERQADKVLGGAVQEEFLEQGSQFATSAGKVGRQAIPSPADAPLGQSAPENTLSIAIKSISDRLVNAAASVDSDAANAAGKSASVGQDLPKDVVAISSDISAGDFSPLQDSSGNAASIPVQSHVSSAPSSPDVSLARPFDPALRQAETRLNVAVEAHVRSPAFAHEFGEKMVWLAGRQGQMAEMIVNPPQLGSVEIRLTVTGGEAGAQFFSANPAVREAIEAALPKLRDLMAQAGINLGEANVRDQSFAQGKGAERSDTGLSTLFPGAETDLDGTAPAYPRSLGLGLVDLYA